MSWNLIKMKQFYAKAVRKKWHLIAALFVLDETLIHDNVRQRMINLINFVTNELQLA